ncbi:MAG: hypothetical protein J0M08_08390 [Bacteroidetes bacterium]|nr:hypothetical protein [Bacteroidota bacterium]
MNRKISLFIVFVAIGSLIFGQASFNPTKINRLNELKSFPTKENGGLTPHLFFCDPVQFAFNQFTVGYEYVMDSLNIGIRIPVTIGVGKTYQEFGIEGRYYIGEVYNYERRVGEFVLGDGHHRFYAGPNVSFVHLVKDWGTSVKGMGGVSLQLLNGLNLNAAVGLGMLKFFTNNDPFDKYSTTMEFDWTINGSIGYRLTR